MLVYNVMLTHILVTTTHLRLSMYVCVCVCVKGRLTDVTVIDSDFESCRAGCMC